MKIASFNVQRFGLAKVSDPEVLSTLVKVKHVSVALLAQSKHQAVDFRRDITQ